MTTNENGSVVRELAGKRALVTGGSRGIGAAIVRQFLDAGAEVLTTARSAAGGAQPYNGALAIPDEGWQDALNLNLLAAVRLDALLAPGMRERRSGAIVHISSAATPTVAPPFLHYTAAKAALENYSRGLALELAGFGVRVNSVSPGRTTTPGGEATREQWAQISEGPGLDNTTPPLGRDGRPDDIANAVLFLVSERASWVTGSGLIVDGGEFPKG
ncbi:SDR family oxidoreductase [Streptomyces sp. NRRL S-813]|uniref:SDR family oxidoreductase n=1 Tax=Streptomyces sp. NRRL S-813 TaxID=1463919 RepID=UPI0004BFC792|nr:SDR family oxidoreductase [Streptomyces sp. NRRL S-813]